jgi:hypothetical protein
VRLSRGGRRIEDVVPRVVEARERIKRFAPAAVENLRRLVAADVA